MQNLIMLNFIVTEMEPKILSAIHVESRFKKMFTGRHPQEPFLEHLHVICKLHANLSESPMADRPLTSVWVCLGLGLEGKKLFIEKQCLVQTVINADRSSLRIEISVFEVCLFFLLRILEMAEMESSLEKLRSRESGCTARPKGACRGWPEGRGRSSSASTWLGAPWAQV